MACPLGLAAGRGHRGRHQCRHRVAPRAASRCKGRRSAGSQARRVVASGVNVSLPASILAVPVKLLQPVPQGEPVKWSDVECNESDTIVQFRREMEKTFAADLAAPVGSSF